MTFVDFYHVAAWGSVLWVGFVLLLSITILGKDFHLGGVVAGSALFYASAWLSPLFTHNGRGVETALFALAPAYLIGGILLHWISRMEHRVSYDPLLQVYNRTPHVCIS